MIWQLLAASIAICVFLFDCQNILSWWKGRTLSPSTDRNDQFTLVVPVYGHPRYFQDRTHFEPFKSRVLVAVNATTPELADLAFDLIDDGWRVERLELEQPSPPKLIAAVLPLVTTKYVVRVDADTRVPDTLPHFVAAMAEDGADICSVKVRVLKPTSQAQLFQDLEYRMAMLSRHFRPWLTSGACMVAKTSALKEILNSHSLWLPGEDIETGRIAHAFRMRIRHLDMEVETEAPSSWPGLFRQRLLWWAGNFRHAIVNIDRNALHFPMWTLYCVGLVYLSVFFKWQALVTHLPEPFLLLKAFLILHVVYAAVTFLANLQARSWRMAVFPPYAFTQALLMATAGSVYFFVLAYRQRSLGRYRFGYRRRREPVLHPKLN